MSEFKIEVVPADQVPDPKARENKAETGKPYSRQTLTSEQRTTTLRAPAVDDVKANSAQWAQDYALRQLSVPAQHAVATAMSNALLTALGREPYAPKGATLKSITSHPEGPRLLEVANDQTGRHLFSPAALHPDVLTEYVARLQDSAFSVPKGWYARPAPLHLALALLNLSSWRAIKELLDSTLRIMDVETTPADAQDWDPAQIADEDPDLLTDISLLCGFGGGQLTHSSRMTTPVEICAPNPGESPRRYKERLTGPMYKTLKPRTGSWNSKQAWLMNYVPAEAGFAEHMLRSNDCYSMALHSRVDLVKVKALRDAYIAWMPNQEITERAYDKLKSRWESRNPNKSWEVAMSYTRQDFQTAVNMVYTQPWSDLYLTYDESSLQRDREVVLARALIANLCKASNTHRSVLRLIPGVYYVALAMLTGVPLLNWLRYAIDECKRRGEGFIKARIIDDVIYACDYSFVNEYMGQLRGPLEDMRIELDMMERSTAPGFPKVLRKGHNLMWAMADSPYHLVSMRDGDEQYSQRPPAALRYE